MSHSNFVVDPLLNISSDTVAHWGVDGMELEGTARVTNGQAIALVGKFVGRIESNGCVIVCQSGSIHGSVEASSMQIDGAIHRLTENDVIRTNGPMVIGEKAEVNCNIHSQGLKISYGAVINGLISPNGNP